MRTGALQAHKPVSFSLKARKIFPQASLGWLCELTEAHLSDCSLKHNQLVLHHVTVAS
jgi:hypothetical protein